MVTKKRDLIELYENALSDYEFLKCMYEHGRCSVSHYNVMRGYYIGKMCGFWCALGCPDDIYPPVSHISEVRYGK